MHTGHIFIRIYHQSSWDFLKRKKAGGLIKSRTWKGITVGTTLYVNQFLDQSVWLNFWEHLTKATNIWNGVIEKFEKRLVTRQMQCLSMVGRHTLIVSVLDSIPTYYMPLYPMRNKVLKQLDQIRRTVLREANSKSHKFHLVKWSKVTIPKHHGDPV